MKPLLSKADFATQLDRRLEAALEVEEAALGAISVDAQHLASDTRQLIVRGGKRLRPYLFYLIYTGLNSTSAEFPWELAVAIELYHQFLLIHDDVIDQDLVRHGGPNVGGNYLQTFVERKPPTVRQIRMAEAMAILAGDLCFSLVIEQVAQAPLQADQRLELLRSLHLTTRREVAGEQLDILSDLRPVNELSLDRILEMYGHKTSAYTVELPFRWATMLSDTPDDQTTALLQAAELLGQAFQVVDDLIGLFSDSQSTGKPMGSDLREGKKTVVIRLAYEHLSPPDWRRVSSRLGRSSNEAQLAAVVELLRRRGIEEQTTELAQSLLNRARKLIDRVDLAPSSRSELDLVLAGLIDRRA